MPFFDKAKKAAEEMQEESKQDPFFKLGMMMSDQNTKIQSLQTQLAGVTAIKDELLEALKEISLGEGAFSRDALTHASNVIENAKEIAINAVKRAEGA